MHVLGEATLHCAFQNEVEGAVNFEVMDPLKKPLLSTQRLVKNGYKVVHDTISCIERKSTGEQFKIYPRGGVYQLPVWVKAPKNFLGVGRA